MLLADREQAGRALAEEVARRVPVTATDRPLVLALPRGGVPVAVPVAGRLGADLDVFLVRKISAPGRPEYGIGAIAEDGVPVFDEAALHELGITPDDLAGAVAAERAELDRRRRRYRADRPAPPVAGRVVIVVDDGLATGVTARAALHRLARQQPRRLVLAVPVCAPGSWDRLPADVICLHAPARFMAVGRWYGDFRQVSDAEVESLLQRYAAAGPFQPPAVGNPTGMFPAENLRDWRGEKVIDSSGDRIGDLEAVYVDTATDEPSFATVKVGMIGRHRLVFVPLAGATVSPSAVRVQYDKKLVSEAPGIDLDGELTAADEPGVFSHYGLIYQTGAAGERRLARR